MGVCVYGFCNVRVCICVGFVMCWCVFMGFVMCVFVSFVMYECV